MQLILLFNFVIKISDEIISKFIQIYPFLECRFFMMTLQVIVGLFFGREAFANCFFRLHHDPRILFTFLFISLILVAGMKKTIYEIIAFHPVIILGKCFERKSVGLFHLL